MVTVIYVLGYEEPIDVFFHQVTGKPDPQPRLWLDGNGDGEGGEKQQERMHGRRLLFVLDRISILHRPRDLNLYVGNGQVTEDAY